MAAQLGRLEGYSGSHEAYNDDSQGAGVDASLTMDEATIAQRAAQMQRVDEWRDQARESWRDNRLEMAIDEDFADGDQLSAEERRVLTERGQPPVTQNLIKPALEWIIGTEKRTRMEARVYPRADTPEAGESAQRKTKLLKYVSDVNRSGKARSRAFRDAVTVGVGWIEDGIRGDENDEPAYSRYESWRNVWSDPMAVEDDNSDARYLFRERTIDLDVAIAMYPEAEATLRRCALSGRDVLDDSENYMLPAVYRDYDSFGYERGRDMGSTNLSNRRIRVRLGECWHRMPKRVTRLRGYGDELNNTLYDDKTPEHIEAIEQQRVSTYDAIEMVVRCTVYCDHHLVVDYESPYSHQRFPLTPIWCYRRGRDNMPYGVVRNIRDSQRDHNARFSKALFILSTNKIITQEDAYDDLDELERIAGRPNAIFVLKKNSEGKRFEIVNDNQLAEEHLMLMAKDAEHITRVSGVTDENLGRESQALSGKAIEAKQAEGSVVTFTIFDNLRFAMQIQGENVLANIERFFTQPKQVRIVGENGKADFEQINQPVIDPLTGEVVFQNDITSDKGDFLIDTADFRQTVRQAQYEALVETVQGLDPEVRLALLDLVVDASDLANKDEIVRRIRSLNGQRDVDEKLSPEEEAERAEKDAEEAEMKQMQKDDAQSVIDERRAKVDKLRAETTETNVEAVADATEAAATMALMPAIANITDSLLESAGFDDKRDIGAIQIPRPDPQVSPEAQAQAQGHSRPPMEVDPNKVIDGEMKQNEARESRDFQADQAQRGRDHESQSIAEERASEEGAEKRGET